MLAAQVARALGDRFRFAFLVLDGVGPLGEQLRGEGFEVVELGRRPGVDRAALRRVRAEVGRLGATVVHAHQYTPFFYAAAARGLKRNRWKVLFTEHGRHVPDVVSRKRALANRWLLGPGDRVTAVSEYVRQALIKNERLPARRVETVFNGIDPGHLSPRADPERQAQRDAARRALNLNTDGPAVIQSARLHPVKDHATALRAWKRVAESRPDARLVLLGDGPLRAELETQARTLGLADHVTFAGQVPDARALLSAGDIALLSSISEGLSVSLLEAMAAGLPVVATDVGGNPELVVNGETGLLTPKGDDAALSDALLSLLGNADRRATMGDAGRKRVVERFSAERMHAAYASHYRAMLDA